MDFNIAGLSDLLKDPKFDTIILSLTLGLGICIYIGKTSWFYVVFTICAIYIISTLLIHFYKLLRSFVVKLYKKQIKSKKEKEQKEYRLQIVKRDYETLSQKRKQTLIALINVAKHDESVPTIMTIKVAQSNYGIIQEVFSYAQFGYEDELTSGHKRNYIYNKEHVNEEYYRFQMDDDFYNLLCKDNKK